MAGLVIVHTSIDVVLGAVVEALVHRMGWEQAQVQLVEQELHKDPLGGLRMDCFVALVLAQGFQNHKLTQGLVLEHHTWELGRVMLQARPMDLQTERVAVGQTMEARSCKKVTTLVRAIANVDT